jgi:hypothetical protein
MMKTEQYDEFTQALQQNLEQDGRVLALIALGSMADATRRDEGSDHDFWVVVTPDAPEDFLRDLAWLPAHTSITFALRQAGCYYTVIYQEGHIVEFAVFALAQLERAKTNAYRILFSRYSDIATIVQTLYTRTGQEPDTPDSDSRAFGFLLVDLWTGMARYQRGEYLSAHKLIMQNAVDSLLRLLVKHLPIPAENTLDNLDGRRRFEQCYPALGKELASILLLDSLSAAAHLLGIAERCLRESMPDYPTQAVETLRAKMATHQDPTSLAHKSPIVEVAPS